ncbi:MAG: hypothetical protein OXE55_04425 [Flavobacteriaceae bacterium]|nr:hypothetical protein [Flavobacteriaceae bacterium]
MIRDLCIYLECGFSLFEKANKPSNGRSIHSDGSAIPKIEKEEHQVLSVKR